MGDTSQTPLLRRAFAFIADDDGGNDAPAAQEPAGGGGGSSAGAGGGSSAAGSLTAGGTNVLSAAGATDLSRYAGKNVRGRSVRIVSVWASQAREVASPKAVVTSARVL